MVNANCWNASTIDVHQIQLPNSRLVQQTLEYIANVHQPSLQNHCFAIEGAVEAGKFLKAQQLSTEKIKLVQESIALHLNLQITKPLAEVYLLNKASRTDTINIYRQELAPVYRYLSTIFSGNNGRRFTSALKKAKRIKTPLKNGFSP